MPSEIGHQFDKIAKLCSSLGLSYKRSNEDMLDVVFSNDMSLYFANIVEESDIIAGFHGTLWHYHGDLLLMTGIDTYVEYDEMDLLRRIVAGDVLVVTQFIDGKIEDRWLSHKLEPLDLRYIEANEELRVSYLR